MTENDLTSINSKLDVIILLLAQVLLEGKNQKESILFLNQLGFDRNIIASIVRTNPSTVSVRLSEAKSNKKKSSSKEEE